MGHHIEKSAVLKYQSILHILRGGDFFEGLSFLVQCRREVPWGRHACLEPYSPVLLYDQLMKVLREVLGKGASFLLEQLFVLSNLLI